MTTDTFRATDRSNKFKTKNNNLIVRNLFYEVARDRDGAWPEPNTVIYTLSRNDIEEDGRIYKSLYRLYMAEEDIPEYEFANKYFDSHAHWKKICETTWMHPYIAEWREELELLIRSKALKSLISKVTTDKDIAKYLLNNNWIEKLHEHNPVVNNRGRPSKQDIKNHLTLITNQALEDKEHYERISNL